MIKQILKLKEFVKKLPTSQKILWGLVILLSLLYFDLYNSITDYNNRVDEFNTGSYKESIRQVVQNEIDKSFQNYQADLDKSFKKYQGEFDDSIADYEGSVKTNLNNLKKYTDEIQVAGLKLESRVTVLESTVKYLQSQIDSVRFK